MIVISDDKVSLFEPDKPLWAQKPFLEIPIEDFWAQVAGAEELDQIEEYARRVFLILEKAWQLQDQRLVDFKLEFGRSGKQIMLADVIDSDSWRKLNQAGEYSDKQVYRDGGPLAEVAAKFREAAELTGRFKIPRQQIVLWTGSDKDKATPFTAQWEELSHPSVAMTQVECSAHRKPVMAYHELQAVIQNIPDAVLIAYIGLSNGAGPMLSANCCVPTITVPATADKFPDDVWSSLRDPTSVPVMTVLKPENAILAALEILAARNPALYANLRYEQEKRLSNIIILGVDC
jgi:phosphoribosylcarboxyaminoimidazole (NCAIR) mutase